MYEACKDETCFFVLKVLSPPKLQHFRCLVNLLGSPLSLIREQLETFFTVLQNSKAEQLSSRVLVVFGKIALYSSKK
jgi:hypothetical protein